MVCSREWVYTAISRAKRLCLLVGKLATAHGFCRRTAINERKTFLVEQIQEQVKRIHGAGAAVPQSIPEVTEDSSHAIACGCH